MLIARLGPLFKAANITGSFTSLKLPALGANLAWNTNSLSGGVLSVVQTVATNPTSISFASGNGALMLSWPWDHTGWRLQAQTNSLGTGLGTNWFDVPASAATNSLTLPIAPNNGSVFYRLTYP